MRSWRRESLQLSGWRRRFAVQSLHREREFDTVQEAPRRDETTCKGLCELSLVVYARSRLNHKSTQRRTFESARSCTTPCSAHIELQGTR